jgi:acyl dehydratase
MPPAPPAPPDDPKGRPKVPFEEIKTGDAIGPFEYELTETLVDRHRRATEQAPYPDPRLAPVSILAADGVQMADQFFDISQSVHAGQRLEVVRIPLLGEWLRVSGQAREKFVKRGRRYVVTDTVTTGDGGASDVVARGTTTGVLVYAEGDESGGGSGPKPPPEAPPEVQERLGPLVRTMTLDKMRLYERPEEISIHTDDDFARSAGLPAAIATGTQFLAYIIDLLYRTYGMGSVVGTQLDVRIRLPVFAGDRVEASADLISREGGRLAHVVRSHVERGDAIVGRAWVPAK